VTFHLFSPAFGEKIVERDIDTLLGLPMQAALMMPTDKPAHVVHLNTVRIGLSSTDDDAIDGAVNSMYCLMCLQHGNEFAPNVRNVIAEVLPHRFALLPYRGEQAATFQATLKETRERWAQPGGAQEVAPSVVTQVEKNIRDTIAKVRAEHGDADIVCLVFGPESPIPAVVGMHPTDARSCFEQIVADAQTVPLKDRRRSMIHAIAQYARADDETSHRAATALAYYVICGDLGEQNANDTHKLMFIHLDVNDRLRLGASDDINDFVPPLVEVLTGDPTAADAPISAQTVH
jgi:hypothetical protein